MNRCRLAYLVSHPIQYQAPLLRLIAAHPEIDLTVFFLSDFSVKSYEDKGFKTKVEWDVPLLEGYKHVFLPAPGTLDRLTLMHPWSRVFRQHMREGRFDALWMHGYAGVANLRALQIARSMHIPVLLRAESRLGSVGRTRLNRGAKEAFLRRLFSTVQGFLAIGALNREYYRHYGVPDERIFPMPYAVDNAFFQAKAAEKQPHRESLRQELGLEPGRPVILFASKFEARKRASDLLKAYALLSPDGRTEPRPYLLFVGDGEERAALEADANSLGWTSIRFLGFKNQTELPAYFDLCDVFVLVSEREPWGLIVNEVMNAGKPIVVSDQVGAAPDLVRDGVNGFVVPVGDIRMLHRKLDDLLADGDAARKMGRESLCRIAEWGFEQDVQGLMEALRHVVPE